MDKTIKDKVNNKDVILIYSVLLYLFILVPVYNFLPAVQPAIVLTALLGFVLLQSRKSGFLKHLAVRRLIYFFVWSVFCSIFAQYPDAAYKTEGKLFIVVVYMLIIASVASKSLNHVYTVYRAYILILVLLILIGFSSKNIDSVSSVNASARTADENLLNIDPNSYGYFIFFGLSFAFILYTTIRRNTLDKVKLSILIFLSFLMTLYTASRGGYIVFALVTTLNTLVLLLQSQLKKGRKALFFLVVIVIIPLAYLNFYTVIEGTALEQRFVVAQEEETPRILHVLEATRVGLTNPVIGVGGGNYAFVPRAFEQGLFSHNSFAEAFASYGFPGLMLFLYFYADFFNKLRKAYQDPEIVDKRALLYLAIFFMSFLAYNVFYVTYLTVEFMGAYIVAYIHLKFILSNKTTVTITSG